ncbi:hypothetical protein GCM10009753_44460 [Streptantibioticus ferralitis]
MANADISIADSAYPRNGMGLINTSPAVRCGRATASSSATCVPPAASYDDVWPVRRIVERIDGGAGLVTVGVQGRTPSSTFALAHAGVVETHRDRRPLRAFQTVYNVLPNRGLVQEAMNEHQIPGAHVVPTLRLIAPPLGLFCPLSVHRLVS